MTMRQQTVLLLILAIALSSPAALHAIEVSLVVDLKEETEPFNGIPQFFAAAGDQVLFNGWSEARQSEVWVTNGTASGTGVLADLCPTFECGGAFLLGSVGARALMVAGGAVWSTGGTAGDTKRLFSHVKVVGKLVGPGNLPAYLLVVDPQAEIPRNATLWQTDGSVAGTRVVGSFEGDLTGQSWNIVKLNSRLLLHSTRGELRAWDGGSGEISFLSTADFLRGLVPFRGGVAFFRSGGTDSFPALWWSDGSPGGTRQIARLDGEVLELATLGNRLYFVQSDSINGQELWDTDGSKHGTRRLSSFPYALAFSEDPTANSRQLLPRAGNRLLLAISDGRGSQMLWTIKPNQKAPRLLRCAGGCPTRVEPLSLKSLGQRTVFVGGVGAANTLYTSDGTPAGTRPLRASPVSPALNTAFSQNIEGKFFFLAGPSLWVTDGTDPGTQELLETHLPIFSAARVGSRWWIGVANGLWVTDGTASGTRLVKAPLLAANESSAPIPLADLGSAVLFCDGGKLLAKRPDEQQAEILPPDLAWCQYGLAVPEIGEALFPVVDSLGNRYWRSDGTAAGTAPLQPPPGYTGSTLLGLAQWNGSTIAVWGGDRPASFFRLTTTGWSLRCATDYWFVEVVPPQESEPDLLFCDNGGVWRVDPLGTSPQRIAPTYQSCPTFWATHSGPSTVFYPYHQTVAGVGSILRCTDTGGCSALPQLGSEIPLTWLVSQGRLFMVTTGATDSVRALWRIDADGTVERLAPVCSGKVISTFYHSMLADFGSKVILVCGASGEVWATDGTQAGTERLLEGSRGQLDADFVLAKLDDQVLFSGYDIEHGWELWQTDGTAAGTRLLLDINPGPGSSHPETFVATNGAVYFSAWDPAHGRELWVAKP